MQCNTSADQYFALTASHYTATATSLDLRIQRGRLEATVPYNISALVPQWIASVFALLNFIDSQEYQISVFESFAKNNLTSILLYYDGTSAIHRGSSDHNRTVQCNRQHRWKEHTSKQPVVFEYPYQEYERYPLRVADCLSAKWSDWLPNDLDPAIRGYDCDISAHDWGRFWEQFFLLEGYQLDFCQSLLDRACGSWASCTDNILSMGSTREFHCDASHE